MGTAYEWLESAFGRIQRVQDALGVLRWDWATMMPPGGTASRSGQLATLAGVAHDLLATPEMGERLIEAAAGAASLDPWQRANLREMERLRVLATAVDRDLVEARSTAAAACEAVWREARPRGEFAPVVGPLERVLALTREVAAARAETLRCSPYEALLREYEPDGREADLEPLFGRLVAFLPGLLEDVLARQETRPPPRRPGSPAPVARQRRLAVLLMERLGFDFRHGRLDVSHHPFCGGTPDDVRITTRYDEDDFAGSLMAVFHETGHALYLRGLPARWRAQPVGQARGLGLHESQSLLVEMFACRSREFLSFAAPLIRKTLGGHGPAWDADNLRQLLTRVGRTLIRVEADPVTYPLHVILRHRLEQALVAGDLRVADLPDAWNRGMGELLGTRPPTDREGCLQDIHWYQGIFGYFPTYTLGALAAAQLFEAAVATVSAIRPALAEGDLGPLLAWLGEKVHRWGSFRSTPELLEAATGRALGTAAFERQLQATYGGTYG